MKWNIECRADVGRKKFEHVHTESKKIVLLDIIQDRYGMKYCKCDDCKKKVIFLPVGKMIKPL